MATTREDISVWFDEAKRQGATHLIVVCDTWDHEDYPVYVKNGESVKDKVAEYGDPNKMQKVMEVYSMKLPKGSQLDEQRSYHLD